MKYRIPALAERTRSLKDPNNEKIRIVHAFVNINDLPLDIPLDPDPRAPKITGAVPKRIVASLVSNDGKFHLKNRGITISVKHCEFDNKKNELAVVIPHDEDQFGILDGAHTYECIRSAINEERSRIAKNKNGKAHLTNEELRVFPNQFVHLEILEKIEDDLADIAEARNFSVQLKAWTLANYRDKFDWLLEALGKNFAKNIIRVSENDEQPVGILDVIQVISAVNPCLFAQEKPAQDAYKNVGKMLQAFVDDDDRHGFKKLVPICKDILRLHDHVRLNFKSKYNAPDETGKFGKFGKTKEAQDARERRNFRAKATYYFLKPEPVIGDDPIDKGLSIPLISGFRVLLVEKNGKFEWLTDPFTFFDKNGTTLIRSLMNVSDSNDDDPHSVGRDPRAYQQLTSDVRRWYLESQFEKKSAGTLL